jgi:hypothetical protein
MGDVAPGSLSSLAAFPPRRALLLGAGFLSIETEEKIVYGFCKVLATLDHAEIADNCGDKQEG